jgi:hypothetical protein
MQFVAIPVDYTKFLSKHQEALVSETMKRNDVFFFTEYYELLFLNECISYKEEGYSFA